MEVLILWALLLAGMFGIFSYVLLMVLLKTTNRLAEVNKQLLIVVAGKDKKSGALRALVASSKPPQGKLKGIADGEKKDEKTKNTDYIVSIGT